MRKGAIMITRVVDHARSNMIAYVALVFSILALAGGAYAAWTVPPHSVGALQLRNRSVGQIKLDPRTIGGSVRHWAQVAAEGNIASSSSRARDNGIPRDGDYVITWSDTFSNRCVALATPRATAGVLSPPSGIANTVIGGAHPTVVWVTTYDTHGAPAPVAFSLAVIC
jgi:hypothetical protein